MTTSLTNYALSGTTCLLAERLLSVYEGLAKPPSVSLDLVRRVRYSLVSRCCAVNILATHRELVRPNRIGRLGGPLESEQQTPRRGPRGIASAGLTHTRPTLSGHSPGGVDRLRLHAPHSKPVGESTRTLRPRASTYPEKRVPALKGTIPKMIHTPKQDRQERLRWGLLLHPGRGEVAACEALKAAGHQVVRQLQVAGYYVDLAIEELRVAVEVDDPGKMLHARDRRRQEARQAQIEAAGWKVVRVSSFSPLDAPTLVNLVSRSPIRYSREPVVCSLPKRMREPMLPRPPTVIIRKRADWSTLG